MGGFLKFEIALISICLGSIVCIGCERLRQEARVPSYVEEHVMAIKRTLLCDVKGINLQVEAENTMNMFCSISNSAQRIRAIRVYSNMLRAIDLSNMPYHAREWATGQYGSSVCHCFRIMRKCGVGPEESMDWFFSCLAKFKCLCLSIPNAEKVPGESMSESRLRRHYLRLFRSDYEYLISILRRFWIPQLSLYLPEEYHAEFVRRLSLLADNVKDRPTVGEEPNGCHALTPEKGGTRRIVSPVINEAKEEQTN